MINLISVLKYDRFNFLYSVYFPVSFYVEFYECVIHDMLTSPRIMLQIQTIWFVSGAIDVE